MIAHRRPFPASGFTLLEMLIAVAIGSSIFMVLMTSGVSILRSCGAADDYSYQSNEQLRSVDIIGRDLRNAISVTVPAGSQTLAVTLPDYYSTYDGLGNPTSAPVNAVISSGTANYGDPTKPIAVTYYVSGGSLIRQQVIPSKSQTTQLYVARNVNNFQLSFVPLSTVVKYSITFAPRLHPGTSNLAAGTTISATVAARTIRIQ